MDTTEKPKRPWWRKKRWGVVAVSSLAVGYPASVGPIVYASSRGWCSPEGATRLYYTPAFQLMDLPGGVGDAYGRYVYWWGELATKHWLAEDHNWSDLN